MSRSKRHDRATGSDRAMKIAIALMLIVPLLIGGQVQTGGTLDLLTQLLLLAVALFIHATTHETKAAVTPLVFAYGALALVAVQLVPLPSWAVFGQSVLPPDIAAEAAGAVVARPISLYPAETLKSLGWVAVLAVALHALLRVPFGQLVQSAPFLFIGVVANGVVAMLQFSAPSLLLLSMERGTPLQAGIFANANHFSSLIVMTLPLIIYTLLARRRPLILLGYVVFALIILLAVGSRAGIGGGLVALVVTVAVLLFQSARLQIAALIALVAVPLVGLAVWSRVAAEGLQATTRMEVNRVGWPAAFENMPFGTGYGTFVDVYRRYEPRDDIGGFYINHAHNDYLEVALEGGPVALALSLTFVVAVFWQLARQRLVPARVAAGLGLLFVLLHSLVDYPLRTMAVAVTALFLTALLWNENHETTQRAPKLV